MNRFHILKAAGLRKVEAAAILGVNPVMLTYWANGTRVLSEKSKHYSSVNKLLTKLEQWVEAGKLPAPEDSPRELVVSKIKAIIKPS